jgi:hypothetical protein
MLALSWSRVCGLMPNFALVDVLFTRTPEGWTFNSSYPRIFGRPWTDL